MTLDALIADCAVSLHGDASVRISHVTDDSRQARSGSLFVARQGTIEDGGAYVADAIQRGAAAVLSAHPYPSQGVACLQADDPMAIGMKMARRLYGDPAKKLRLIGITGTNGKTTTAYLLRHLLRQSGSRMGMIGTIEIDNGAKARTAELTTPGAFALLELFAEMVQNDCDTCIMEVSSHALAQGRVDDLSFQVAVYTNLTGDHLDYHSTTADYAAAKAKLFTQVPAEGWAIGNADDPYFEFMLTKCGANRMTYGSNPCDCTIRIVSQSANATKGVLVGPWGDMRVSLSLIGIHNLFNLAGAVCVAHALGVDRDTIEKTANTCPHVPGRLERVSGESGDPPFHVFVDYAHTDDALANVLTALRPVTENRLHVLFGCGGDRDQSKRPRMAAVACELADCVAITSDNPRTEDPQQIIDQIVAGIPIGRRQDVRIEPDREKAIAAVIQAAQEQDVVLIAGKGHEDYQIIGKKKHTFDDRKVAREVLSHLAQSEKWKRGAVS